MKRFVLVVSVVGFAGLGCDGGPYVAYCGNRPCMDGGSNPFDAQQLDITAVETRDLFTGLQSIEVTPADATLVVRGESATQDYTVTGVYSDGRRATIPLGTWSNTATPAGAIARGTSRFVATGLTGGTTRVAVEIARDDGPALRAETGLTVRFQRDVYVNGAPPSVQTRFATPVMDPARQVTLRYPLDGAVMPQNVAPPDVQWEGGDSGDAYRIRLVRGLASVTGYLLHSGAGFRFDWTVDATAWRGIAETSTDQPVQVTVDRATGTAAVLGQTVSVRLATGSLAGVVYYWDLRAGKILRIFDEGTRRDDFLPHPPRRTSDGSRCVACHAVSRDGRYMAAEMWEGQGPSTVYDLTSSLTADPAPTRFSLTDATSWVYASFSPDSTRLIANRLGGLLLIDPATGRVVTARGTALPANDAVQPSWSPDGRTIAFVNHFVGPGPTAFSQSELDVLPVTAADTFGAATRILQGSAFTGDAQGGSAIAYPSWTPDSRWLAFQHGPYSESDQEVAGSTMRRRFPAAMYLTSPTGTGSVRLTRASQDGTLSDAYFPNFSPFVQGGFYWVVYFSRRDYGNALAGTRGTQRRQLWVSAVRTDVTAAGGDPSSVPYWLPGQDVASDNVSGFWAPQACRPRGETCQVSSECCAGTCGPDAMGRLVCNPPTPDAPCRTERERCGATGDCCAGLECAANVCLRPPG